MWRPAPRAAVFPVMARSAGRPLPSRYTPSSACLQCCCISCRGSWVLRLPLPRTPSPLAPIHSRRRRRRRHVGARPFDSPPLCSPAQSPADFHTNRFPSPWPPSSVVALSSDLCDAIWPPVDPSDFVPGTLSAQPAAVLKFTLFMAPLNPSSAVCTAFARRALLAPAAACAASGRASRR